VTVVHASTCGRSSEHASSYVPPLLAINIMILQREYDKIGTADRSMVKKFKLLER
jgi:hypothetical protein